MSRRPNDQAFTKTEVRRLMKVADAQGVKNSTVSPSAVRMENRCTR